MTNLLINPMTNLLTNPMANLLIKIGFILTVLVTHSACVTDKEDDLLLLISYDAFRPEYFDRGITPFMNDLRKKGSYADYMRNVFPTKTFTNHHTISTGMFPEVHGVLGNTLYDVKLKQEIKYSYELFHYNEDIMPIWILNQKYGRHSGCMMWPGSNFVYNGRSCDFTVKFDMSTPFTVRVDKALSWFSDPKTPANFVMLYFEEPDYHGHAYSPDSKVITEMVQKMDNLTRYIEEKLVSQNLRNRTNVIYVSDHGMDSVSPPNFIDLRSFLVNGTYNCYGSSPVIQIVPEDGKFNVILQTLKIASKENGHFMVYTNDELPVRWHSKNKDRMGPITVVADAKYAFQDMYKSVKYYEEIFNIPITPSQKYGIHGYDNQDPLMRAMFFANGPKFRKQFLHPPFDNLDLFNLFCLVLGIEHIPNNGTMENIRNLLVDFELESNNNQMVLGISLTVLALVLVIGLFISYRIYRKRQLIKHYSLDIDAMPEGEKLLSDSPVLI